MSSAFKVPTATELERGLLTLNYFPRNSKDADEIPPSFTTKRMTRAVGRQLVARGETRQIGFDAVRLDLTRFNLVPRRLSIPHPTPYSRLVACLADNWSKLKHVSRNQKSEFRPTVHEDGRISAMNYGSQRVANQLAHEWTEFGARFRVTADISNFYPSVYTHAIAWALVGHAVAKSSRGAGLWFNQLDKAFRDTNRGETTGLHVGPGTSAVAAELLLSSVDSELAYDYLRHIDDFVLHTDTLEEAESFVLDLTRELEKYNLRVSPAKTRIEPLPLPERPDWIRSLMADAPANDARVDSVLAFVDDAVELAKAQPEASALKWAVNSVMRRADLDSLGETVAVRLFKIAFHNPVVLPAMSRLFKTTGLNPRAYEREFNKLLQRHALYSRTDGMTWVLHMMRDGRVDLTAESIESVVDSRDSLAIALLQRHGQRSARDAAVDFGREVVDTASGNYDLDRHWLLLYELFRKGLISSPYEDQQSFDILKAAGVTFVGARAPWRASETPF